MLLNGDAGSAGGITKTLTAGFSFTGMDITIAGGGASLILGHYIGYIPGIAAGIASIFTACYFALQVYDHHIVRDWFAKRSAAKKMRQIAKLQARQRLVTAQLEALDVRKAAETAAAQLIRAGETAAVQKVEIAKAAIAVEQVKKETEAAIKKVSE